MNKPSNLLATAATALVLFSLPAFADETALSPFAAQFGVSYTDRSTDWGLAPAFNNSGTAAEAALLYRLDQNLNLQIDYAYQEHKLPQDSTFNVWHLGGAIFHRDADRLLGLAGQTGETGSDTSTYGKHYIIGPVLEIYQANMTLGARANYVYFDSSGYDRTSGEIIGYGQVYPTSKLALKLAASYSHEKLDLATWDSTGVHGEAEYAVISNASVFLRGQYAYSINQNDYTLEDTQAMFGLRFYFNSNDTSIMDLHRSTTIDNTNELLENSSFSG